MRDADVDEVPCARLHGGRDGRPNRREIDPLELGRLRRTRVRRANEMHHGGVARDRIGERRGVQGISENAARAGRHLALRFWPREHDDRVPAGEERVHERAADIAGAAGHEHGVHSQPPTRIRDWRRSPGYGGCPLLS
jgi:hypothetical protein